MSSDIKRSPSSPLLHLLGTTGAADGLFGSVFSHFAPNDAVRRRSCASAAFLIVFITLFFIYSSTLYHYSCPQIPSSSLSSIFVRNNVVVEEDDDDSNSPFVDSVAILLPGWEVLLITERHGFAGDHSFFCLYPNNETSLATVSAPLPWTNQSTFKCELPKNNRRKLPFLSPELVVRSPVGFVFPPPPPRKEILWWNYLAYESVSTQNDVVVFAKGVNNHQGINTSPHDLRCVFFLENGTNVARTRVHISNQEVFRCSHPRLIPNPATRVKVSLEVLPGKNVIPSVAYYNQRELNGEKREKATVCAMTMVYNSGKFLREWVAYHASVGIEKFIFYDNDSDDNTAGILREMRDEGFEVERETWIWPKAQEAGFSHAALMGNATCAWMIYLDVDEFLYSPAWAASSAPSKAMVPSLVMGHERVAQVSIKCNEFGPSGQQVHPVEGVTQGYTCRRKLDNRHKSIVLLEAVEASLTNAIHHFKIDWRYTWRHVGLDTWVVNHYKYQAWEEFKGKFRRRVSAYVVDWTKNVNMNSQDRAPGLGANAVEPRGWEERFCEVEDERLKMITRAWFGLVDARGRFRMAWQKTAREGNDSASSR